MIFCVVVPVPLTPVYNLPENAPVSVKLSVDLRGWLTSVQGRGPTNEPVKMFPFGEAWPLEYEAKSSIGKDTCETLD